MLPYLAGADGNPSGGHRSRAHARRALEDARERIAGLLGADFGEVVFTSGGTEADNLAVVGGVGGAGRQPALATRSRWCARPWSTTRYSVPAGRGRPNRSRAARGPPRQGRGRRPRTGWPRRCTAEVGLVSVMAVNNEIGTVQPLATVAGGGAPPIAAAVLHTDAVQAVPWLDVADRHRAPPTWWRSAPTSSAAPRGSGRWWSATASGSSR